MTIVIIILCITLILFLIKKSKNTTRRIILILIGIAGTLCIFTYTLWLHYLNIFTIKSGLPFHLCSISLIVVFLTVITNKRLLISLAYFCGFPAGISAILFPNIIYTFPHFRYIEFFIAHMILIIIPLYYMIIEKVIFNYKDMIITYLCCMFYIVFISILNYILKSNYLYISKNFVLSLFSYIMYCTI